MTTNVHSIGTMPNPFGGPPLRAKYKTATMAVYIYQNSKAQNFTLLCTSILTCQSAGNTLLEGVGVSMRVAAKEDAKLGKYL